LPAMSYLIKEWNLIPVDLEALSPHERQHALACKASFERVMSSVSEDSMPDASMELVARESEEGSQNEPSPYEPSPNEQPQPSRESEGQPVSKLVEKVDEAVMRQSLEIREVEAKRRSKQAEKEHQLRMQPNSPTPCPWYRHWMEDLEVPPVEVSASDSGNDVNRQSSGEAQAQGDENQLTETLSKTDTRQKIGTLDAIFSDFDGDGDGFLTLTEVEALIAHWQDKFSDAKDTPGKRLHHGAKWQARKAMVQMDKNGDGKIDHAELEAFLCNSEAVKKLSSEIL